MVEFLFICRDPGVADGMEPSHAVGCRLARFAAWTCAAGFCDRFVSEVGVLGTMREGVTQRLGLASDLGATCHGEHLRCIGARTRPLDGVKLHEIIR